MKRNKDNELWLQTKSGPVRRGGYGVGAGDLCGRGRSVVFLDANGDVYPDLFVGNDTPRRRTDDPCDTSPTLPNEESKLFINVRGNGSDMRPVWGISEPEPARAAPRSPTSTASAVTSGDEANWD